MSLLNIAVELMGAQQVLNAVGEIGNVMVDTAVKTERMTSMMNAASGTVTVAGEKMNVGATNLAFIGKIANDMGINIIAASDSFAKLAAATQGTRLEGEKAKDMFEALAAANTKLGGSNADLTGMVQAFTQMISKGTVSMEELRGQLGERLPGAMKAAADSMGLTTAELIKQVSEGKVLAEVLLPKLAEAINKTYNDGKFDTASSNVNRLENAWLKLKQSMIDTDFVNDALKSTSNVLEIISNRFSNTIDSQIAVAQGRIKTFNSMGELGKTLGDYAGYDINLEQNKLDALIKKKEESLQVQNQINDAVKKEAEAAAPAKLDDDAAKKKAASEASKSQREYEQMLERSKDLMANLQNDYMTITAKTYTDGVDKINQLAAAQIKAEQEKVRNAHIRGNELIQAEDELQKVIVAINEKAAADIEKLQADERSKIIQYQNMTAMDIAKINNDKVKQLELTQAAELAIIEERYQKEIDAARKAGMSTQEIEDAHRSLVIAKERQFSDQKARVTGGYLDNLTLKMKDRMNEQVNFNEQLAGATMGAADTVATSFADMAISGKASWEDMALSVIKSVEMMIAKILILKAIEAGIGFFTAGAGAAAGSGTVGSGFASIDSMGFQSVGSSTMGASNFGGGIMSSNAISPSFSSTPRFANGGITNGISIAGEAGPEAVVPLPNGRSIPVQMTGSSGVQINSINITVTGSKDENADDQGTKIGKAIRSQLESLIDNKIMNSTRSGNALNRTAIQAF